MMRVTHDSSFDDTGMRIDEIRRLRWRQVDLDARTLTLEKAKTAAGIRTIPMHPELYSTLTTHASWIAEKLGPLKPDWYVFPLCSRTCPVDPLHPVTTIKSAWTSVRRAAGVELRFHDLRHTAYTKLVEARVPDGVIEALMGHISKAMKERYSHVRMAAMRKAVESLTLTPIALILTPSAKVSTKVKQSALVH